MTFVISILKSGNYRRSCPYQLGQLPLRQARFLAQMIDFPSNVVVGPRFLERGKGLRISTNIALM
jgi:hypothetical protein